MCIQNYPLTTLLIWRVTKSQIATWVKLVLINSGGASAGESDLQDAVTTAVITKRAGGQGLIMGRKAFQKPVAEGMCS